MSGIRSNDLQQSSSGSESDAPILRLVNEDVLKKIFEYYLQECYIKNGSPPSFQNLLLLTHICKEWRELVTHSPSIWSWFSICLIYPNTDYISLLRLLLRYSGSHPLSFEFYEWHRAKLPDVAHSLLDMLLEKRHLWKDVDITLDSYPAALSSVAEGQFPGLELVSLTTSNGWTIDRRLHLWRALHSSPLIREVTLNEFCNGFPNYDAVSWNNIRSLEIDVSIKPDRLLEILKACNQLECLTFHGYLDWVETPHQQSNTSGPIIFPRLQQMYLTLSRPMLSLGPTTGQVIYSWLLGLISAPALTRLHLWLSEGYSPEPFVSFCKVSGCRLHDFKLRFESAKPKDEDAAQWLRLLTPV